MGIGEVRGGEVGGGEAGEVGGVGYARLSDDARLARWVVDGRVVAGYLAKCVAEGRLVGGDQAALG